METVFQVISVVFYMSYVLEKIILPLFAHVTVFPVVMTDQCSENTKLGFIRAVIKGSD